MFCFLGGIYRYPCRKLVKKIVQVKQFCMAHVEKLTIKRWEKSSNRTEISISFISDFHSI